MNMKTEHFQLIMRMSGNSTGKCETAGTSRLRNTVTVKELDKLALQSTVIRESLKKSL